MSTMPTSQHQASVATATATTVVIHNNNNHHKNNTASLDVLSGTDECPDHPQNGREARNLAEKHRRDKLNAYIQDLATMVPHVAQSSRRQDKTAVLRFAAHGLRLQYVFGKSTVRKQRSNLGGVPPTTPDNATARGQEQTPTAQPQPHLTDALLQLLDSFFVALTCHGQIVVISGSVEQLLGHCQSDLYGQNILHITHPEDQMLFVQQLIPRDLESLFRPTSGTGVAGGGAGDFLNHTDYFDDGGGGGAASDFETEVGNCFQRRPHSPQTQERLDDIDQRLSADRRCFTVRLARAGTRAESTRTYEIVKIDGCFRRSDYSTSAGSFPIVSQLIRRSRSTAAGPGHVFGGPNALQHDAIAQAALHGISGNDIVLVAMARIIRPPKVLNHRLAEANLLEYRTRHLIDGRIIDCDQRIGLVAGYMKDEVRNLSPFSFMHQDDVRWVIVALRQMYDCSSDYGESCYRLLSRNGHFIYLHTKGFLEIDKATNKVHSFVCVNTLLDEDEGRRRVQEMKSKFSVIIKAKIPTNSLQDVPASQNPQQLERIVLYLIDNLQKRHDQIDELKNVTAAEHEDLPTLALVPPEAASVKNSISESVNAVNITAAKNLQHHRKSPLSQRSTSGSESSSMSPASSVECEDAATSINSPGTPPNDELHRPSVLQMRATADEPQHQHHQLRRGNKQKLQQISVLKRLRSTPPSVQRNDDDTPAKRQNARQVDPSSIIVATTNTATTATTTAQRVICASLHEVDQSLQAIGADARQLCQQRSYMLSPVPQNLDRQLDAILVEHQQQQELLVNIQSEYSTTLRSEHPTAKTTTTTKTSTVIRQSKKL